MKPLSAVFLFFFALLCFADNYSTPQYIVPNQQLVLQKWLSKHTEYQIAIDEDCKCASDIASMRQGDGGRIWKGNPNYHPYYTSGDFNDDGKIDFAVVLKSTTSKITYLAIFNAPYTVNSEPIYFSTQHGVLFYGEPRPKPYRLVMGGFNSEGSVFIPKGKGYEPSSYNDDE